MAYGSPESLADVPAYYSDIRGGRPISPDILDDLADLRDRGVEDVLVCPVGFVSDHLEIRWDIDNEAQDRARELGLKLDRIEMPNDDPRFVEVLASIVRRALGAVPSAGSPR